MALTSAEKKKKQEELNRQGKLYLQAKAKGDKRAMAAARATADKIRKEAGWSYDAKTGTTYEKVSPIQKKGTVVNSKENLSMAKAGANLVKAVQQAAKKSSILTNSPASKSSVQQAKKAADTAAKKKAAPSTNKVLELGRGPIKTDGLTKSSVQKAVDAKRASTLNQLLQKRAQAQGTMPKTSMLAKDQAGPFSAIPLADALRNLTQGPLQMQKLNDKLAEQRTYKRQMEENLPSVEQALRAAIAGTKGSLGSAYETAKASVGNELAFLLDQGKNSLTRDLSDLGSDYKRKYGDATINFDGAASRAMRESARMRELATDDMGTVGKFLTDTGISIAQNAPGMALAALGPLGAAAGAAYMGTSAAGSKAYEVQANGGSANEALTRGIVSGLIEGVTEKFSIDSFLKSVQGTGTARQMIKNMLRQMGVEASEEGASYALNYLADKVAKDPNATFSLAELAQNMGMGAVSGAVFGGLGSAARSVDADMLIDTQKNRGQVSIWDSVHEALGDERFAQAESEISTKNNKSTDPLLLNRLQLPDSMADGTLVTHSIAQDDAKSNSVSEALRRAMGETLKNPKIQQRNAYRAQIDAAFSGKMTKGEKITLGDTPDIVAKYGMQAPLTMTQTTARKIAYPPGYLGGKHNLGIPALKYLPEQLADPIAILKSKTEGDSVVVLTAWNDTQGNPVIIPVHFGKDGTLTVENAIPSAYGKRNLEALFGENGENILYTKNNKSIDQLLSSRLQLPNAMADDTLVAYSIAQAGAKNNQTGDVLRRVAGIRTDENGALVQGSWADGGIKPKLGSDVDVRPQNTLRASRSAVSASDVGRYIQSAMEGQVTGSLYTGKLGGNAVRDVYAATGIDADGYAVKLTEQAVGDTMRKIDMGSDMTMSDLSHIGEMVLNAEQAERGGTILRKDALGMQDLKQSRGAQGASLPIVRLIKNSENGGYVITMAIDRANRSGYILSLDTVAETARAAQTIMPVSTPQAAQTVQDTAQTVAGENTQVQAGVAQNASDGSFRVGETVRALDRGNIGTVVQYYPESGLYDVNFRDSQTGSNETVTLSADMLEGMWTGERLKNPQTQAELTSMRNDQLDALNSDSYDLTGVTEQEAWQWAERVHAKHEAQRAGQAAHRATPSTVDAPMLEGGIVDRIVQVSNDCEVERLALMRLRQEMQLTEADLVDAREYAAGRAMTRPGKITAEKAGEIMRYGEALKAYNMRMREVRDLQTQIKEQRRVAAEELIAASDKWHDTKHGKILDIRTPERAVRYVMGDTAEANAVIDAYFTPVHRHEAESIRWQNEQRGKLREITKGSTHEESVYVHMYNRLQENPGDSALQKHAGDYLEAHKKKINMDRVRKMHDQMVELTRSFYDDINEAGLRNGEEALEFRQNYIPSLPVQQEGGWINRLLRGMGIETMADELPTSIAGKTEEFRPVRKWQQFRQQRRGTDTEFDAVKAMDQYITNAAHAIYHTDDIHNLRTLEEAIRYKHSTEGGQAELDAIRQNPELSIDERTAKREEVWERSTTAFPSFPTWLAQYTNNLAGKKSAADRKTEHGVGRGFYRAVSDIETKVASNMVGFNVSTAFTNFIPLAQGKGELRTTSMMRAMKEFLGEKIRGRTDYRDASTFLTNRIGSEKVVKTGGEKLMDASGAMMGAVDEFTSNVLHRARVKDNVEVHNMRYEDAVAEADSWTAGLMGDRSLGAMPNIFNEKNFFTKAFTMFQLEVANQYGYLFEDLPHNAKARTTSKAKAVGYVAGALTQILAASLLYNDLAEELTGRRPALDPVGIVNDFVGQLTGYAIPSSVDLVRSAMDGGITKDDFKTEKGDFDEAAKEAALATANQIPGLSMLAEGGRLPVTAAIPSPAKLGSGVMAGIRAIGGNPAEGDKKALSDAGSELSKLLTYLVMPTGGSQLKKTVTGARDVQAGGRYGLDFEGNRVLNYPLYTDDGNTARTIQALLFGSTATKPGREWIESEFTSGLDADQTKTYDKVRQTGADQRTVYNLLHDLAGMSDTFDKRDYLSEFDNLNKDQKQAIDRGVIAGEGKPADYTDYDSMILSSEYNDDSKTSQAVRKLKDTYGIPVSISHRLIKNIQNMDNVNQTDDQNLLTSINQAQYLDNSQKDALALELIVNATESRAKGWIEDVKGKMDVREYAGYALKLAEVKQRYTGQDDADKKADADMWAYLKKEDLSEDARLALCDALSIDIVPENYSMLTNKNQIKQMGALEQSELPFDTYMRVWEMKKATNEDGTYKYKKDQVVNEMERMGLTRAQINAVCQSFGWAAPYKGTSSKKSSSSSKKTSSSGSKSKSSSSNDVGSILRELADLPKLPKIG